MTFWDIDQEINLVSNKPQDKKVHATEARSAFGSTDFAINLNSSGAASSNNSGRDNSLSSEGFSPSSLTTSPTTSSIAGSVLNKNATTKASGSVFTPNHDNPVTPKNVSKQLRTAGLPTGSSIDDRYQAFESHQRSVPPLPVPDLKETLDLYTKSLEGLVSAESWQRTKDNVDAFMTEKADPNDTQPIGEKLQGLLQEHAAAAKPNWLESFWDDMYLFGRDALPINVNYCFGFSPSPFQEHHSKKKNHHKQQEEKIDNNKEKKTDLDLDNDNDDDDETAGDDETQLNRAACLLHAMGSIYNEIRLGKWSLDFERKSPQCMSQYRRVFCASRIPGEQRDSIETYLAPGHIDLTSDEMASNTCTYVAVAEPIRHVIIIVRNRYFAVDIFDKTDDEVGHIRLCSIEEIGKRIAKVLFTATKEGSSAGAPVGVLTTTHRTDWWRAREELKELGNSQILSKIQSAICIAALDSLPTTDSQERARIFLHGPGTNRWFDRHTLIITRNGDAGLNFEHAVGDGATTLRVVDETYRREKHYHSSSKPHHQVLSKSKVRELMKSIAADKEHNTATTNIDSEDSVIELRWKLDGHIDFLMRGAYTHYVELIQSTETTTLEFNRFGGDYIKKSGNSPDAFVQLAFQLTHHRLFGRPTATYEAASTRTYSHGRTEVLRSCTRAATDFCQLSGEPIFSHRVNSQIPPQLTLLRNATEAHVNYMRRAKDGRGVDRHLLGLRMMAAKAGIQTPDIFTDENFKLSSHWGLSTSHCGSSALTLFGFGPVVPDGFGLGYMIKNDNISFVITSKYTHRYHSSTVFSTMLESSLLQMRAIVDADWESREKSRPKAMTFSHPTTYNDIEFDPTRGFKYAHKQIRSLYANPSSSSMSASPSGSFQPDTSY